MIKLERLGIVLMPDGGPEGPFAKFNAGMIRQGNVVHMLYRWGERKRIPGWKPDLSDPENPIRISDAPYVQNFISYARLSMDGKLLFDANTPAIYPTVPFESTGCEDPRIVSFEDAYYIFYTAWDSHKPRVAIAKTTNFERYEKLGIIDNFTADKDAFIFPKRIKGQIAYVHRIDPSIQIDYFDSFEALLDPRSWAGYEQRVQQQVVLKSEFPEWEGTKIGGSIPPIKTVEGWLFAYHGVGKNRLYHVGMALLDRDNPSKVIARLPYPVLSPETDYEFNGDYHGCIFPQGAYLHSDDLYVCYGAADKYVAMAKVRLDLLLAELKSYPATNG